jgi:hypothetical protein
MDYPGQDYYRLFAPYFELQERRNIFSKYGIEGRISERLVQSIWYDQRLKSKKLKLDDGRKVTVLSPGKWNTEEGPDFKDAQIIVKGNKIIKGDVEVHLLASDWIAHKHQESALYDSVILHVCLWNDLPEGKQLLNSSGQSFPQLTLFPALDGELNELNSLIEPQDYPYSAPSTIGACHKIFTHLTTEQIAKLLDWAGEARMGEKIGRMAVQLEHENYNQLLYEGIMEALGYKNNKEQFRRLAQRANLNLMAALVKEHERPQSLLLIQSWLLGLGGFLCHDNLCSQGKAESINYIDKLTVLWQSFEQKFKVESVRQNFWAKSMRPANLPERRLVGMAHILASTEGLDLVGYFEKTMEKGIDAKEDKNFLHLNREIKDKLMAPLQDFWDMYYKPGGALLQQQMRTIGPDRAMVILVNILIPFFLLLNRNRRKRSIELFWWRFYRWYPKLPQNSIYRLMTFRLFGNKEEEKKLVTSAQKQFGLMQIFNDFCSQMMGNCTECNFKRALEQKKDCL